MQTPYLADNLNTGIGSENKKTSLTILSNKYRERAAAAKMRQRPLNALVSPQKIQAVKEWPFPTSWKQLQRFLSFANFYRCFIRNYSQVAAPLTTFTSTKKLFHWRPEAESAFKKLKHLFPSAPVQIHPVTTKSFVVDVSDVGVGAMFLHHSGPRATTLCIVFMLSLPRGAKL